MLGVALIVAAGVLLSVFAFVPRGWRVEDIINGLLAHGAALIIAGFITTITKFAVGRLRPNFNAYCASSSNPGLVFVSLVAPPLLDASADTRALGLW